MCVAGAVRISEAERFGMLCERRAGRPGVPKQLASTCTGARVRRARARAAERRRRSVEVHQEVVGGLRVARSLPPAPARAAPVIGERGDARVRQLARRLGGLEPARMALEPVDEQQPGRWMPRRKERGVQQRSIRARERERSCDRRRSALRVTNDWRRDEWGLLLLTNTAAATHVPCSRHHRPPRSNASHRAGREAAFLQFLVNLGRLVSALRPRATGGTLRCSLVPERDDDGAARHRDDPDAAAWRVS